jgi:hypothetical protein
VRRAKLYYLRDRVGKAARMKMEFVGKDAEPAAAAAKGGKAEPKAKAAGAA